jgi:methylmalonyl-CoA/ethylmalonyl-CoA epimerase
MAKSLFTRPNHMGVVVRDLEKTVSYYESLGMGPFVKEQTITLTRRLYYGKPVDGSSGRNRALIGNMGAVRVQLLQPEGKSMFQEFLDTRGEGVHHYAFQVDDIEEVEADFVKKGVEILSSVRVQGGGGHIIIDSGSGILLELLQPPAEWLNKLPPLASQ